MRARGHSHPSHRPTARFRAASSVARLPSAQPTHSASPPLRYAPPSRRVPNSQAEAHPRPRCLRRRGLRAVGRPQGRHQDGRDHHRHPQDDGGPGDLLGLGRRARGLRRVRHQGLRQLRRARGRHRGRRHRPLGRRLHAPRALQLGHREAQHGGRHPHRRGRAQVPSPRGDARLDEPSLERLSSTRVEEAAVRGSRGSRKPRVEEDRRRCNVERRRSSRPGTT